jgi:hypothetical protein
MKKIILLFVICLLLSGCSTEVVLKIDEEKVTETIKVLELKDKIYFNNELDENIKTNMQVFEREYEFYDMNEFEDNGYVGKTYKLSENLELWSELSHVRPCYETFVLEKTDSNIILNTSDEYRCGYLFGADNVTLIVESELELISSNADKVEGNRLIWNIDNNNYKDKSINFNYKIGDSKNNMEIPNYAMYLLIFVFCIITFTYVFIKIKNKENNKI